MSSLARKHFEQKTAELAAKKAGTDGSAYQNATPYELQLLQLVEDKRRLSGIQSMENRAELKRSLLPKYEAYVNGVLAGGQGVQDEVLMTVMCWRLDAHDFDGALVIARYALEHGLVMPDQFKRNTATLVAEEIAIHALKLMEDESTDKTALLEDLVEAEQLTKAHDMPDVVRARLHKALGYCMRDIDPAAAQVELKRAFELDEKSGVKTDIGRLDKQIKKAADTTS